jgi:2-iminoacetate synthase
MAFFERLTALPPQRARGLLEAATAADVERVLAAPRLRIEAAPVLFSAAARPYLEQMARRAAAVTRQRFGRTITLYAPLYLSSHCVNRCAYCGFAAHRPGERRSLSLEQALREAELVMERRIRHLLLVTGEAPERYGLEAICEVARHLRPRAASVAVEIFPCDIDGYRRLARAGVDSLVLYQETYLPGRYAALHPAGPKRDFARRLDAVEAGGAAGFRSLGIGALLGLGPWRLEGVYLAFHADHLGRAFPGARIAVSFPRLRPIAGEPPPAAEPVADADLVQLIVGMRLLFPDAEIVISTREPAALRDHLIHLGVTRISAASRTSPGGYGRGDVDERDGQFCTDDRREVAEVAASIRAAGFDVVTKDFDAALVAGLEDG